MTIEYHLQLEYQLQTGWLEPFVHGLQQGIARARRCCACKKTSFPPIRICQCSHVDGEWVELSGKARIVHRCDGVEGSFALVQFDGADTQTTVRLEAVSHDEMVAFLKSPLADSPNDYPSLVLTAQQPIHLSGGDS